MEYLLDRLDDGSSTGFYFSAISRILGYERRHEEDLDAPGGLIGGVDLEMI